MRLYVPVQFRQDLIVAYHDENGHFGTKLVKWNNLGHTWVLSIEMVVTVVSLLGRMFGMMFSVYQCVCYW